MAAHRSCAAVAARPCRELIISVNLLTSGYWRPSFETHACSRTHASQDEGCGWLRRFNNFSPHPEEHALARASRRMAKGDGLDCGFPSRCLAAGQALRTRAAESDRSAYSIRQRLKRRGDPPPPGDEALARVPVHRDDRRVTK